MSASSVRVVVVPADGSLPVQSTLVGEPGLDRWLDFVGGINTVTVFFADGSGCVVVTAMGRQIGFQSNARATMLMERMRPGFASVDHLYGCAVFVGLDEDGGWADVPVATLAVVENLFAS